MFFADFSSKEARHVRYVLADDVIKAIYLNSLDAAYFAAPLDTYYASVVKGEVRTSQELMQSMQGYSLEKGLEATSTGHVPKVLSAPTFSSSREVLLADRVARLKLTGPIRPGDCPDCFLKGFRNAVGGRCGYVVGNKKSCTFSQSKAHVASAVIVPASSLPSGFLSAVVSDVDILSGFDVRYEEYLRAMERTQPKSFVSYVNDRSFLEHFCTSSLAESSSIVALAADSGVDPLDHVSSAVRALTASLVESSVYASKSVLDAAVSALAGVSEGLSHSFMGLISAMIQYYWDNAASLNITNRKCDLVDCLLLPVPIPIGGLGSSVTVTHVGYLPWLPRKHGRCYYSKDATTCLLTLGGLHSDGGSYETSGNCHLEVRGSDGALLDRAVRATNNLYKVSPSLIASGAVAFPAIGSLPHATAAERARMDAAELLHCTRAVHCNDDDLCRDLTNGHYFGCGVTAADVRKNRQYRGKCIQCLQGRMTQQSFGPSLSQPPSLPGQKIYADIQSRAVKSVGGRIAFIRSTCGKTGFHCQTGIMSKKPQDICDGFMEMVRTQYNAFGYKVDQIVCDADPQAVHVIPLLAAFSIELTLVTAGQYSQREENRTKTLDNRFRSVSAGLPFFLPPKYDAYLDMWVGECTNDMSNSLSDPSTPYYLVRGKVRMVNYDDVAVSFGSCCMVRQFDDKKHALAKVDGIHPKNEPVSEFGVCMGYSSDVPGSYVFLLENGFILAHKVVHVVNVHSPFG